MKPVQLAAIAVVALALIVAGNALFVVQQTQYGLVLQFGEIKKVLDKPGLYVKIPVVQSIEHIDKRILLVSMPPEEIIASDRKRLLVDAFARFKVSDPIKFYRAVRTESTAVARLQQAMSSVTRNLLGTQPLSAVLSDKRAALMVDIRDSVNEQADTWGIDVVDVRIRRADLPEANSQSIYKRMQTERQQEAARIRAEGEEEALKIRSEADRKVAVTKAEARRDADVLRGQGEAERNRIFGEAYSQDPDFFDFYRSLKAYEMALQPGKTTYILEPESDFFRYFGEEAQTNPKNK